MVQNKALIFKAAPEGFPEPGKHMVVEDRPVDLDSIEIPANGFLTKNLAASLDPYQRGRMRLPTVASYNNPYPVGSVMDNFSICKILKSNNSAFAAGDLVSVIGCPIEEYSVISENIDKTVNKLNNPYNLDPKLFIAQLGMPGMTAYSSLYEIAPPKKGETIFISAASGAVGAVVGQLAKREGMKVIGSVGDDKKLDYIINELGFDGGFNYKKEKPADALKRLAPGGINTYYDNVGGEHLEAAIGSLNRFGVIICCGMISQYNIPVEQSYPVRNLREIVSKELRLQGFIVISPNFWPKYEKEFYANMGKWISEGSFKVLLSEVNGIDNAATGLAGLFKGENFGKTVLVIAEP